MSQHIHIGYLNYIYIYIYCHVQSSKFTGAAFSLSLCFSEQTLYSSDLRFYTIPFEKHTFTFSGKSEMVWWKVFNKSV